ncbi:MAG TPA: hypothetical protein VEQ66_05300 [Propionibacteriaceae bacterium]|nr:hypothetical protein [Propionibacteriaceae bacterium]
MTDQHTATAGAARPARTPRLRLPRQPFLIIRANAPAYLTMNVFVYGLLAVGFVVGVTFPELRVARQTALEEDGTAGLVLSLLATPWLFALTIFAVNTLTVAVAQILLPSLIVPFAGIAVFAYRAFILGLTLAPIDRANAIALIPHSLTILIEFQAYVLLMLGAYLLGRAWLRPRLAHAPTRRRGYLHGLRQVGWLSLPASALFVVGALYEAFSLAYLVPVLIHSWG